MSTTAVIPENLEKTVEEYRRLRDLMIRLHSELFKLARNEDRYACARRLGMLSKQGGKKTFIFDHELEMDFLQDYLTYMYRPHGINLVEQMLNRKRYVEGSEEHSLLTNMAKARFSVFQIREIIAQAGVVARDLVNGDEYFVADMSLPQQNATGHMLAFRIFPMNGFWMHTGACIPFGPSAEAPRSTSEGSPLNRKEEQMLNEVILLKWREEID
jgi:hypothetical protein